jgi:hypothetical protein
MDLFIDLFLRILRGLLKIVMLLLATALIMGLVSVALVWIFFTIVWSLLTGRKPAVFTIVSRFRQTSDNLRKGLWPGFTPRPPANEADIVDVQAHEVRMTLEHSPLTGKEDKP